MNGIAMKQTKRAKAFLLTVTVFGLLVMTGGSDAWARQEERIPNLIYLEEDPQALQERFDRDRGRLRVVLLVSPACPVCYRGVVLVQQLLEQRRNLELAVSCVWLPVFRNLGPEAEYARLPKAMEVLSDPRVVHYWTPRQQIGRAFKATVIPDYTHSPTAWDTFIVFDRNASWQTTSQHVLGWGRTIEQEFGKLIHLIEALH
jgi:hypothetical protein